MAAGDVDSDGFVDLYLTNFGPPRLYRNNGDGTFGDATAESGLTGAPGFGVSAAFVDYDRDGRLDLYVGHNVDYRLDNEAECPNQAGVRDYCPPQVYGGMPDRLYRNLGGGRFEDASDAALVGGRFGPALGGRDRRLRRRRLDRHLRGQRRYREHPLDEPGRRYPPRRGAGLGLRGERSRGSGSEHGSGRRRLRRRRRRRPLHDASDAGGETTCTSTTAPVVSPTAARPPGLAPPASPIPAGGPRGSTTTTTAGWICWPSTAPW